MEYTKDIILNVQYGKKINLKERKAIIKLINIYKNNKFIINILFLTIALIAIDLYMVSNFINLLIRL
ncbi:MAG: hypothetical protein HFJ41_06430 [Clostridia bacterium]|nr:hypothetical protein [Clostridia bacterium]